MRWLDGIIKSLGQEDPLEKEMATHSSILAWEIAWTEELGTSLVRLAEGEHSPSAGEPVPEQGAPGKCSGPRPGSPVPSTPERRAATSGSF